MINEIKGLLNHRVLFDCVKIDSNLNILFGGNGVGKSSFLEAVALNRVKIESTNDFKIMYYKNSNDNSNINKTKEFFKISEFAKAINSKSFSEGQSSIHHILSFLQEVKNNATSTENIVVLLDEVDSGVSVENINMLIWVIKDLIDTGNVQLFIATNQYHWAYVYNEVLNMYTGKYIYINNYDEYFELLNKGIKIMSDSGERDFDFLEVL